MVDDEEMCYCCDCCGEDTEDPVSIHAPIAGGARSPLDFCPECAAEAMQKMVDRLGHEHGSGLVLEIKSRQAKKTSSPIKAPADSSSDEEE